MSEVINWLRDDSVVSRRGPNAIVIMSDYYDYDLSTTIHELPQDKDTALNQMEEVLSRLVDPGAEDNSITIVCAETTKTWDIAMIENKGQDLVVKEIMDLLKKDHNWNGGGSIGWRVSGWQSGNENWEVNWERVNFV